jgi:hypothetical protein
MVRLPKAIKENHENLRSGWPLSGPRFEPRTSRIPSRMVSKPFATTIIETMKCTELTLNELNYALDFLRYTLPFDKLYLEFRHVPKSVLFTR